MQRDLHTVVIGFDNEHDSFIYLPESTARESVIDGLSELVEHCIHDRNRTATYEVQNHFLTDLNDSQMEAHSLTRNRSGYEAQAQATGHRIRTDLTLWLWGTLVQLISCTNGSL